ncbi:threonine-phosphate decarboxylase CobD [Magnetofaba australis]|nr:threonine-phosphate decarboxylase CobD [Magnetofaba australis]
MTVSALKIRQSPALAPVLDRLEHGGNLEQATEWFGVPAGGWLDLSTGINPVAYTAQGAPPTECWRRLPEAGRETLLAAARRYYGAASLIAAAGSQAIIQALPQLWRAALTVGVLAPSYAEHAAAWRNGGHTVRLLHGAAVDAVALAQLDVLVVVNPNNPTARLWPVEQLLAWRDALAAHGGWLVVDEAFMDPQPEQSVLRAQNLTHIVALRSLGKFFGLAGARVGFAAGDLQLLNHLDQRLGPWRVAGPAQWVAEQALSDSNWQREQRRALPDDSARLGALLQMFGLEPSGATALFQWVESSQAAAWRNALARQGVWVRLFEEHNGLRFGLPGCEAQWARLMDALIAAQAERGVA